MNLKYLFELQGGLMEHIKKEHKLEEISFDKTVLALLVELGECANEWRGFKYWSKDQEPRIKVAIKKYIEGLFRIVGYKNKLLEEYVDGLHFVLQLGILTDFPFDDWVYTAWKEEDIEQKFFEIYRTVLGLQGDQDDDAMPELINHYWGLGKMLGFTWEEIEAAYIEKNQVNHERQLSGY